MHLTLVFFTFFLWSSTFTIGKQALFYSTPLFVTAVRMLVAGLGILIVLSFRSRISWKKISKSQWIKLFFLSITGMYLTNFFEFEGLKSLTASRACFIYSLTPFLAACFSYLHFKEKITWKKAIGLMLGVIGMLPVICQFSNPSGWISWGEIELLFATALSTYGWVILRQLRKEEFSSLLANGIAMSIGGVCALLHSAIVDVWNPIPVSEIIPWAQSVIVLIIVSNLICYNLYGFLLKKFTSTFVSFIGLVTPLFASFFGWLFLNELPSVYLAISLPILALGFWFVYAEELHLGYVSKSKSSL